MRITREMLLKAAQDAANERVRLHRGLVCAYLSGSLLQDDPLLGGTTDIDLFLVYDSEPVAPREIVALTDEVHLDIAHLPQRIFSQPRQLRVDSWLGSYICNHPILIHDTHHWFDFTQASISSQFNIPENTLPRALTQAHSARLLWSQIKQGQVQPGAESLLAYFKGIEQGANAVACLSGTPLAERRFILNFPHRAEAIQRPELSAGLINLFAGQPLGGWAGWMENWQAALQAAGQAENCPPRLHPARKSYYVKAAEALFGDVPAAALWLMLRTWSLAVAHLPGDERTLSDWNAVCRDLGLGEEHFAARLAALDAFLDSVEEALDAWGKATGAVE